jgi:hypothetical protein
MKTTKTGTKHGMGARGRYRPPMMGNVHPAFRAQMGIAPAVAVAVKWGLPWLLTAGGIAVTAVATKNIFPNVPINYEKIGVAALLGGGGVAAYLMSSTLPEDWRPVSYAAAVAGVAVAAYVLFSPGPPPDLKPPTEGVPGNTAPLGQDFFDPTKVAPGPLKEMFRIELPRSQSRTGGTGKSTLTPQTYEIFLENRSDRTLSPFVGLAIYDEDFRRIWWSPSRDPVYGRKMYTLAPGERQSVTLMVPPFAPVTSWWKAGGGPVWVRAQIFVRRDDPIRTPAMESEDIPIDYAPTGIEL